MMVTIIWDNQAVDRRKLGGDAGDAGKIGSRTPFEERGREDGNMGESK